MLAPAPIKFGKGISFLQNFLGRWVQLLLGNFHIALCASVSLVVNSSGLLCDLWVGLWLSSGSSWPLCTSCSKGSHSDYLWLMLLCLMVLPMQTCSQKARSAAIRGNYSCSSDLIHLLTCECIQLGVVTDHWGAVWGKTMVVICVCVFVQAGRCFIEGEPNKQQMRECSLSSHEAQELALSFKSK